MSNKPHTDEITLGRMKASYECGNIRGKHDAEKHARIAAFAAIRRAAEVARSWDYCILNSCVCHTNADQIRIAIRAAIGSEKA